MKTQIKRNIKGQFIKTIKPRKCITCLKEISRSNKFDYCMECFKLSPLWIEKYKKMVETHKKVGVGKWMKGRKIHKSSIAKRVAKMKGRKRPPFSDEWRRRIGEAGRGRVWTPEQLARLKEAQDKYRYTPEYRQKQRLAHLGEKSANWKGGITPLRIIIRESKAYIHWRAAIYQRDNYTCQLCGRYSGQMHVDHYPKTFASILHEYQIKSLLEAINCKELWDTNNGRVLCVDCHKKTDTWGYKKLNYVSK